MMLDWQSLVCAYGLDQKVRGVVHIGAHLAEEAAGYAALGVPVWWIEANPALLERVEVAIAPYPNQFLIHALVTEKNTGKRTFHLTNNEGMSSSIFQFGTHQKNHPDTVFVEDISLPQRTLDSLVAQYQIEANMLVMDIQGAEGLALKGAKTLIPSLDFVMSEVNVEEVYEGCVQLPQLKRLLSGFHLAESILTPHGWGDALWVRELPAASIASVAPKEDDAEPVPGPRDTIYMSAHDRIELLRWYAKRYGIHEFIETGTAVGETTNALRDDFDRLDTIELDHDLYERAKAMFAPYPNITCWEGDSGAVMEDILGSASDPVIFWLDGHHSGPGTAHGDLDTPIRAELAAAFGKAPPGSVILIDDARVFEGGAEHHLEPHYGDYPSLDWVAEQAGAAGFDYDMHDDVIRLTPR